MNYRKLGITDLKVSTICLGTMTWGEQNTQEEGFEQMDYALDQGVNFWDTAELYAVPPRAETFGHTEIIIGNWFKKTKKRKEVILATKVAGPSREYLRGGGYNYGIEKMTEAINDSLKRLQTDYIDLYQLHWPERNTNMFGKLGYEHKDKGDWNKFEDVLGNLQKFVVGREITKSPRLLVVAQPTWGVDVGAAVSIRESILDLAKRGSAVIMISQDLEEVFAIAHKIAVLHSGLLSEVMPASKVTAEQIGVLMGGGVDRKGGSA